MKEDVSNRHILFFYQVGYDNPLSRLRLAIRFPTTARLVG